MASDNNKDNKQKSSSSKNLKNSKKDKLLGALRKNIKKSDISGFVGELRKSQANQDGSSADKIDKTNKEENLLNEQSKDEQTQKPVSKNYLSRSLPMGLNLKKIFITLGIIILSVYLYQTCFTGISQPTIFLSSKPISASALPTQPKDTKESGLVFSQGSPIYVHLANKDELNVSSIRIKILSITPSGVPAVTQDKANIIGEVSATVKPKWKHVQTYFQKEFFETKGKYKIQILKPDDSLFAEQSFEIK